MIKQGMKPGDVFEDGGRRYVVTRVLPGGNYESEADGKGAQAPAKPKAAQRAKSEADGKGAKTPDA